MRLASLSDPMPATAIGGSVPANVASPAVMGQKRGCGCGCGGRRKGKCCPQNQATNANRLPINLSVNVNPLTAVNTGFQSTDASSTIAPHSAYGAALLAPYEERSNTLPAPRQMPPPVAQAPAQAPVSRPAMRPQPAAMTMVPSGAAPPPVAPQRQAPLPVAAPEKWAEFY